MQVKFDHVALRAKNPEQMKDFLIELLGFEIGFRPDFPFKGYWLYANGKDIIHIFNEKATFYKGKLKEEDMEVESIGKNIVNHICFFSDDYEEMIQRIKDMNLKYDVTDAPGLPIKQVFIKAPDNLLIEIQAIPKK